MKTKITILLLTILFSSCATVKSLNDYDYETSSKKNYSAEKILGTVTVSSMDFIWSSYKPNDTKTQKLFLKLQNKAYKKYGKNIELINISIGDNQLGISIPLYTIGGGLFLGGALTSNQFQETQINSEGKEETNITNDIGYGTCMGISFLSLASYLFKGVKASATVVYSDSIPDYTLVSEDELQSSIKLDKIKKEQEIEKKQKEERIKNHEIWIGMTKNELILSIGEPIKATVKDDGIETTSVSGRTTSGLSSLYEQSSTSVSAGKSYTKTNRTQIYFYSNYQIYIDNDIVTEIYDLKGEN